MGVATARPSISVRQARRPANALALGQFGRARCGTRASPSAPNTTGLRPGVILAVALQIPAVAMPLQE